MKQVFVCILWFAAGVLATSIASDRCDCIDCDCVRCDCQDLEA